jgi:hypothetical protein
MTRVSRVTREVVGGAEESADSELGGSQPDSQESGFRISLKFLLYFGSQKFSGSCPPTGLGYLGGPYLARARAQHSFPFWGSFE